MDIGRETGFFLKKAFQVIIKTRVFAGSAAIHVGAKQGMGSASTTNAGNG
jgi:hypothetical protein